MYSSYLHIFESKSAPLAHTMLAGCAIGPLDTNSKLKQITKRTIPSHEGATSTIQ